jgi:hypothetical protein
MYKHPMKILKVSFRMSSSHQVFENVQVQECPHRTLHNTKSHLSWVHLTFIQKQSKKIYSSAIMIVVIPASDKMEIKVEYAACRMGLGRVENEWW